MKELHGPRHQDGVTLTNLPVQPWLARPCGGDHARVVFEDSLEDPEAPTGGNDALATHPAQRRHVLANLEAADRSYGGRVVVPARDVIEEASRRDYADAREGVRPLRSHALEKLDRAIEM